MAINILYLDSGALEPPLSFRNFAPEDNWWCYSDLGTFRNDRPENFSENSPDCAVVRITTNAVEQDWLHHLNQAQIPILVLGTSQNLDGVMLALEQGAQDYIVLGDTDTEQRISRSKWRIWRDSIQSQLSCNHLLIQAEKNQAIQNILIKIRHSLDLEITLNTIVTELRQFLRINRVFVYQFNADQGTGVVVAESLEGQYRSLKGVTLRDAYFSENFVDAYADGRFQVVSNIYSENLAPCHVEFLETIHAKALIVVPIILCGKFWGLLAAHHCDSPRVWSDLELDCLKLLSHQISLGIHQADLYYQTRYELDRRREAEAKLDESQNLYSTILSESHDVVLLTDSLGELVFVSPNIESIFGYSLEDIKTLKTIDSILGTIVLDEEFLHKASTVNNLDYQITDKFGKHHDLLISIKRVAIGQGTLLYTIRDITKRRQVELALASQELRFLNIFEHSGVAMCICHLNKGLVKVNKRFCDLLGYSSDELITKTYGDFTHPDDLEQERDYINQLLQKKINSYTLEKRYIDRDNNIIWAKVTVACTGKCGGSHQEVIVTITDISDRKKHELNLQYLNQQLEKRVQQRTQSLAEMNHRLSQEMIFRSKIYKEMQNTNYILKLVLNHVSQCIFWTNDRLEVMGANQKFADHVGLSLDQIIGKHLNQLDSFRERQFHQQSQMRVARTKRAELKHVEVFHRPNGKDYWLESSKVPLINDDGEVLGVLSTYEDVTDRTLLEQVLEKRVDREMFISNLSQQMLYEDFNVSLDISLRILGDYLDVDRCLYWRCIDDSGYFTLNAMWSRYPNLELKTLDEYQPNKFPSIPNPCPWIFREIQLGHSIISLSDISELPPEATNERQYMQQNRIESLLWVCYDRDHSMEIFELTTIGRKKQWDLEDAELLIQLLQLITIAQNRHELQLALEESKARLAGILDSVGEAIISSNERGEITLFNKGAEKIFGYSGPKMLGQPLETILPTLTLPSLPDHKESQGLDQINSGLLLQGKHHSGSFFPVEACLSRLTVVSGRFMTIVARDVSDRIRSEAALREAKEVAEAANRAKSEFLANMSHEIRTPMNAIVGMTELALGTQLSPQQENYLRKVHRSADSLLHILNDILDFSKIEAGKLDLEMVPFNLEDVLSHVSDVNTKSAQGKGLKLDLNVSVELPFQLVGDPFRLQQVLINLVSNAIKFTSEGQVQVLIEPLSDIHNNPDSITIRFSVNDTGIGIDQDSQHKLFRAFSQADASTTRKYGGTGLGLAICSRLVNLMGGTIGLQSQPGQGSCFWFTLTFKAHQVKYKNNREQIHKILKDLSVLVVDDSGTSLTMLGRILHTLNCQVELSTQDHEVINLLQEAHQKGHPYHVVILDQQMPRINGLEIVAELRSLQKQCPDTAPNPHLIIMTAYDLTMVKPMAQKLGIQHVFSKPVPILGLLQSFLTFLHKDDLIDSISEEDLYSFNAIHTKLLDRDKNLDIPSVLVNKKSIHNWSISHANYSILLVEDHVLNQEVAADLLSQYGLQVSIVSNGQEALQILEKQSFDVVLMDCQMPIMDGYEATRQIRKVPEWVDLPIIAMTAHALQGDRDKCIDAGMNDYVAKPINIVELMATLERWLPQPIQAMSTTQTSDHQTSDHVVGSVSETAPKNKDNRSFDKLKQANITAALNRLEGRVDLYTKLVSRFHQCLSSFEQDWHQAQGNLETQSRLAHTLKGLAGSVGYTQLQDEFAQLELAAKSYPQQLEAILPSFLISLHSIVAEIEDWKQDQRLEKPTSQDHSPGLAQGNQPYPILKIHQHIEEILSNLEADFTAALQQFQDLEQHVQGTPIAPALAQVRTALDNFDTDHADQILRQLLTQDLQP